MNSLISSFSHNYQQALDIIEAADLADSTKVKYRRVLAYYLETGHLLTDSTQLARFADTLSSSRRSHLKAAVKLWSDAMILQTKQLATPQNIDTVHARNLQKPHLNRSQRKPALKTPNHIQDDGFDCGSLAVWSWNFGL